MGTKWREIPKVFRDNQKKYKDTIKNATNFPLKLFPLEAGNQETGTGFTSKEDFIASIIGSGERNPQISLRPSTEIATDDFSVNARWISNITNYSNKEDDIASLIYSQERPTYQIDTELNVRDKVVFFTQESIFGSVIESGKPLLPKDFPVFMIDSYNPQYDEFGVFQYATLTLKRVVSYKVKETNLVDGNTSNTYTKFDFYAIDVQPKNVKRMRITWNSKPINWLYNILDGSENIIPWKTTPNTKGLPKITPFLPRKESGTKINFVPSWINEIGYWTANEKKYKINDVRGWTYTTINKDQVRKDGTIDTEFPFFEDTTPSKGLIEGTLIYPSYYKTTQISFALTDGASKIRDDHFDILKTILDFSSPFNFMGYKLAENRNDIGDYKLPRPENSEIAAWKTTKDQTLFYGDAVSNLAVAVDLVASPAWTHISQLRINGKSKTYIDTSLDILNGSAVMFGEIITTKPDNVYMKDFDFSPNPKNWNEEEIKKYTGVIYDIDLTIDGSSSELELPPVNGENLNTSIVRKEYSLGRFFQMEYLTSAKIKTRTCGRDWYKNYNENWVFEIEFADNIDVINQIIMKYFGGYEYKLEFFQNSYIESFTQGDEYCKFEYLGTEYKLPPLTYSASNKRNPLSYGETKIYGTGGTSKSQQILIEANEKLIKKNSKTLYHIKTGKKVKNQRRN